MLVERREDEAEEGCRTSRGDDVSSKPTAAAAAGMETPPIGPGQQHVTQSCDESGFSKALQTARRGWREKGRETERG